MSSISTAAGSKARRATRQAACRTGRTRGTDGGSPSIMVSRRTRESDRPGLPESHSEEWLGAGIISCAAQGLVRARRLDRLLFPGLDTPDYFNAGVALDHRGVIVI